MQKLQAKCENSFNPSSKLVQLVSLLDTSSRIANLPPVGAEINRVHHQKDTP